ncbi:MAG: methyltransferase domain-containing protein [Candidatus Aminicenantes bacterium]|nr:methyltransferase domain-containing protein [Candidatus Aminicenantes bacterium]
MEEKLLHRLRCPSCYHPLYYDGQILSCSACQQSYLFYKNIPLLSKQARIDRDWERFFNGQVKQKGDTIAANSYLNEHHFYLLQQAVLEMVGPVKNMNIIDIGCGTGHFSASLAKENLLVGLDLSLQMLMAAEAKGFYPIQASALELPLAENSFDLVLANSIIQCIHEIENFLAGLVRLCLPGGRIIISAFNCQNFFFKTFRQLKRNQSPRLFLYPLGKIVPTLAKFGARPSRITLLFYPFKLRKKILDFKFFEKAFLLVASSFVLEARKSNA